MSARVALINMPFAPADRASVQIAILKSLLTPEGIEADELYANLDFFDRLREQDAHFFYSATLATLVAEWFFSRQPLPSAGEIEAAADDLHHPLQRLGAFVVENDATGEQMVSFRREFVPRFMDDLIESRDWSSYEVLAFTLTYPQMGASFWLAEALKERHPHLQTVFGGALSQLHPQSAAAYLRAFPFVDHVVVGEAEPVFGPLVARLLAGEPTAELDGVFSRTATGEVHEPEVKTALCERFDDVPFPDYRGFAAAREALPAETRALVAPDIPVEMARGCVWAVKKVCSFCGFYPEGGYRRKSDEVAIEELIHQQRVLGWSSFYSLDAYIPHGLLNGVFRRIPEEAPGITFPFVELRTKMKRREIEMLVDAGVTLVQPGVECMEEGLLDKILKGVTLTDNLYFLKWCRELDLDCSWNLLLGLPDATPEEMERQLEVLQLCEHLAPPQPTRLLFVRASTYHLRPDDYGLTNLRPDPFYAHVHPPALELEPVAYEFEADWDMAPQLDVMARTTRFIEQWRARWALGTRPELTWRASLHGGVVVEDTRGSPRRLRFSGAAAEVLELIVDRALGPDALASQTGRSRAEIDAALISLIDERLALETRGLFVGMPVRKASGLAGRVEAAGREGRKLARGERLNIIETA